MRLAGRLCLVTGVMVGMSLGLHAQTVRYVDVAVAGGAADGTSWDNAFADLNAALAAVAPGDAIWVARGVYRPGDTRGASFQPPYGVNDVALYGGFTSGMATLDARDWRAHLTVLSGDLEGDDTPAWANRGDNAYTVLRLDTNANTRIDGFVIRGGNADTDDLITYANCYGGGMYINRSPGVRIANCVFTDNTASGSGALYFRRSPLARIEDCVFSGNRATFDHSDFGSGAIGGSAGGLADNDNRLDIQRSHFAGNQSVIRGGVMYTTQALWDAFFVNSLMIGNVGGGFGGGALYIRNQPAGVMNNTFSLNVPEALFIQNTTALVTNSILWQNGFQQYATTGGGALSARYSNIENGAMAGSNGNIDADPQFYFASNGVWSAAAQYDATRGQTLLTDALAKWIPGAFVGGTVNPNTALQFLHFSIATNTASTLTVWGDATAGGEGQPYRLHDWHLGAGSPCIDAGDPASDWSQEPDYPLGRIDMGAFGNMASVPITNAPPAPHPEGLRLFVR